MSPVVKLSSPATSGYWEVPILFEDEHLMALDKPAGLLTSPDRYDPERPNLMKLLHAAIERGVPWARERHLTYLMNAHRLDFETSGIILLAKAKPILIALADAFGTELPVKTYHALVQGSPEQDTFEVDAPLGPHPANPGLVRVDRKNGKRARTGFELVERFRNNSLIRCRPFTGRTHQIRVHLSHKGLAVVGDELYGGGPLLLSRLKADYRLKPDQTERPLMARVALHASELKLPHPVSGAEVGIAAPWPKDFTVALKYLRRYAVGGA
jgi:RluA family pseudouridine synthase